MADTPNKTNKSVARPKRVLSPEQRRNEMLKAEPKVKVYGNPMFVPSLGEVYTFAYCGNTVTIKFDETYQEYPKTIAELIETKLAKIARTNTSRSVNTKIS